MYNIIFSCIRSYHVFIHWVTTFHETILILIYKCKLACFLRSKNIIFQSAFYLYRGYHTVKTYIPTAIGHLTRMCLCVQVLILLLLQDILLACMCVSASRWICTFILFFFNHPPKLCVVFGCYWYWYKLILICRCSVVQTQEISRKYHY